MKTFLNLLKVALTFLGLWSLCIGWTYLFIGIFSAKMNVRLWGDMEYVLFGVMVLMFGCASLMAMVYAKSIENNFSEQV